MIIDFANLPACPNHGRFTGKTCPICEWNPSAPVATAPPVAAVEEYDRSTWWPGLENELHDLFEVELGRLEVEFVHARTDVKSTIENGWPDFSCFKTAADGVCLCCFVEFKNKTGRLRKDQVEVIERLRKVNIPVIVTGDFREARDFVKVNLAIPERSDLSNAELRDRSGSGTPPPSQPS